MPPNEEVHWIQRIRAGERDYFTRLYKKYDKKLFALCLQFTRNHADAEEQLQEIFLRVIANIDSFRERSSFSTWITRVSVNHLNNFLKRRVQEWEQLPEDSAVDRDPMNNTILSLSIEREIQQLPEGFRQVFILHEQLGYKHEEIGQILEIGASTSRSQLSRARLLLREKLRGDYYRVAP